MVWMDVLLFPLIESAAGFPPIPVPAGQKAAQASPAQTSPAQAGHPAAAPRRSPAQAPGQCSGIFCSLCSSSNMIFYSH